MKFIFFQAIQSIFVHRQHHQYQKAHITSKHITKPDLNSIHNDKTIIKNTRQTDDLHYQNELLQKSLHKTSINGKHRNSQFQNATQ